MADKRTVRVLVFAGVSYRVAVNKDRPRHPTLMVCKESDTPKKQRAAGTFRSVADAALFEAWMDGLARHVTGEAE